MQKIAISRCEIIWQHYMHCSRQDKIYTPRHVKKSHESITFRIFWYIQPELNKSARSEDISIAHRINTKSDATSSTETGTRQNQVQQMLKCLSSFLNESSVLANIRPSRVHTNLNILASVAPGFVLFLFQCY